VATMPRIFFKD